MIILWLSNFMKFHYIMFSFLGKIIVKRKDDKTMQKHDPILGNNPNGPDVPLGLSRKLVFSQTAYETFRGMSTTQQQTVVNYIQSAPTEDETKKRVDHVFSDLENGKTDIT